MCKDPVALGSKPRSSEREKEHGVKRSQTKRYRGPNYASPMGQDNFSLIVKYLSIIHEKKLEHYR